MENLTGVQFQGSFQTLVKLGILNYTKELHDIKE